MHKQVILDTRAKNSDDSKSAISDDVLAVNAARLEHAFREWLSVERGTESSRETEVSL